jgi:hypothetical protein
MIPDDSSDPDNSKLLASKAYSLAMLGRCVEAIDSAEKRSSSRMNRIKLLL